jgi:TDG/mug DNA glycosylase family protein
MKKPVLPDLLQPGLTLVFCGTAPGTVSAQRKQYYAHPQNKFWETLYEIKLTPHLLDPMDYRSLTKFGIGLTDIAKHASGMDHQLPKGTLGAAAADELRQRIQKARPKILAFTSKRAGQCFCGPNIPFGKQDMRIADTEIWVLPSPSPAARRSWKINKGIWQNLADEAAKL